LETFELDDHYIWSTAFFETEVNALLNHGWEEVGFVDIDLSDFKSKLQGYGVFWDFGLLREPSGSKGYSTDE
jgi:hypothetical protein